MDLNDPGQKEKLLIQRQASRIGELETWLAILVVRHGYESQNGWRYRLSQTQADLARAELPTGHLGMSIDYDVETGHHLLDVV